MPGGRRPVEEKCRRRVNDVLAQLFPRITLRENVFRQAFRAITAVGFLDGLKDQIRHIPFMLRESTLSCVCMFPD